MNIKKLAPVLFVIFTIVLAACVPASQASDNPVIYSLKGGILATFQVNGETFNVWVTGADAIQQVLDLQAGKVQEAVIPLGEVVEGTGEQNYNAPYHWHLDPASFRLVKSSDTACNVSPKSIEQNIQVYITEVHQFCPSPATLIRVQDYRAPLPGLETGNAVPGNGAWRLRLTS